MLVKNRFCHFRTIPWLLKKNMQNQNKYVGNSQSFAPPPLPLQLNFRHCMCVAIFIIWGITKRKVMASRLQVTPTKLQVTRSKHTSLTAETNKFQLTNMLFITF